MLFNDTARLGTDRDPVLVLTLSLGDKSSRLPGA